MDSHGRLRQDAGEEGGGTGKTAFMAVGMGEVEGTGMQAPSRLAGTEEGDHTGTKDNGSNDNGVGEEDESRWLWASSSGDSHSSSSIGRIETPSCGSRKNLKMCETVPQRVFCAPQKS